VAWLLLGGCLKHPSLAIDNTLPEAETVVGNVVPETILATAAESSDPTPRARSLGLLIATSDKPGDGDWAKRALEDADPWVQRAGVYALSDRLQDPGSVTLLEDFVATEADPYVRGAAGLRLASTGSEKAKALLAAAWRAEGELWRIAPLALAATALGDTEAIPPLKQAIRKGELALDIDFLMDLAQSGQSELLPALREGAAYVENELRLPYAVALITLGDPSGEQAIRKALGSRDVQECLEALDYLAVLRHTSANTLLKKARSNHSHHVRTYAELVLASRQADSTDILAKAADDEDPEIRALAVRYAADAALNPTAHRKVARFGHSVVSDGLMDPDPSVRTEAMRAAAKLVLRGEAEALQRNLQDPYEALRIEAAGTLLQLQHRG